MLILGIETSCDETAASVIQDGKILSNIIHSQLIHKSSGGVVPELASREHEYYLNSIVKEALRNASVDKSELEGISVTQGPGLAGALLTGVCFAKGFALGLEIPIVPVNHLEAHIYANFLANPSLKYPFVCLLVSGGHTQLWDIKNARKFQLLGETRDDAAGEAFDKGARIMNLGYPGGPEIEKCALGGDKKSIDFPRAFMQSNKFEFSFSGLKTSLLYYIKKLDNKDFKQNINNIAASYQAAIIDVLVYKLKTSIKTTGYQTCVIAGGVGANELLRRSIKKKLVGTQIFFPPHSLCTDNAAMIAYLGEKKLLSEEGFSLSFPVKPNFPLT